jgi:hypothetical protein
MSDSSLSVNSLFLAADDPLGGATLTPEHGQLYQNAKRLAF